MTTKNFNRAYTAMIFVMGAGIALLIGGLLVKSVIIYGLTLLLGGVTGAVVTYAIEKETKK